MLLAEVRILDSVLRVRGGDGYVLGPKGELSLHKGFGGLVDGLRCESGRLGFPGTIDL